MSAFHVDKAEMKVEIKAENGKGEAVIPTGIGGRKDDQEKPDLSLLPRALLEEAARAYMHGEKKYGRYNYLKGFTTSRLIAATMRHLAAYNDGEELDADGFHHLGGALASIGMLLDLRVKGKLSDERYK